MAVTQLINLFESLDSHPISPTDYNMSEPTTPQRTRLSLRTAIEQSFSRRRSPSRPRTSASTTPASSVRSSPSSSYRCFSRPFRTPITDMSDIFSTPPKRAGYRQLRRQPSSMDLALEAERNAIGIEHIGLGLFEPRPRSQTPEFGLLEGQAGPVVLDDIFEVMERA